MRTRLLIFSFVFALATIGLTACGAAVSTPGVTAGSSTVTVSLTDTGVTASQATFAPGARCHFTVTNHGAQPHQFWLMPQTMQQRMRDMPMAQWRQQLLYSSQTIMPGQTVSFDYTFPMMRSQPGLAFGCYTEQGQSVFMMPIAISAP